MVSPRRFLRALVARTGPATVAATLCLPAGLALGAGAPAAAAAPDAASSASTPQPAERVGDLAAAVPAEPDTAPLRVRIDTMSRTSLPARGRIRITGTVTNRSDETWTTINLYTFAGTELVPMTTPGDLSEAMDVSYDADVGRRQVNVGEEPGTIDVLEPGATASYDLSVPVDALPLGAAELTPGVYWFGVHALGQGGSSPRDEVADGRARTFLPSVPRGTDPIPAALVVPLTHPVLFSGDGSLADEEGWTRRLSPGGRLHDLLALGEVAAENDVPITWSLDPALLDAVGLLAGGNPERSLTPTGSPDEAGDPDDPDGAPETGTTDDPDSSGDTTGEAGTGTPEPDPEEEPDAEPLPDSPAAVAARDWLATAAEVFAEGEVVTLPYGNPDVVATQAFDPGLLDLALAQTSTVLDALGVEARALLAPARGYVDAATVAAAPVDTPLLVEDRFLAAPTPAVARLGDRRLLVSSSGAREGSPGPGRALTAVGLRQRLLAEAAVRAVPDRGEPTSVSGNPLVVQLPTTWDLATAEELFERIDRDWIDFGTLDEAVGDTPERVISTADLTDATVRLRDIEDETFEAARELIGAGDLLQRILVGNAEVGARVTEQALSGISSSVRRQQGTARTSLGVSQSWLEARLGDVRISASSGVTLSGDSGSFLVTLTNDLTEPVRVGIAAASDDELSIGAVEPLELGPESRTSVLLSATTSTSRVHNVTLMVTDVDGTPLGASEQLPIRSVLVSDVIWVIIGVGVGTLFVAIALRLRRRILAARRAAPDPA